ncbi:MAG: hypothetical protein FWG90_07115 [Oscillospiraceae bacterium]|nr:hypothetical protein [Oscillospiraceae bacterium]
MDIFLIQFLYDGLKNYSIWYSDYSDDKDGLFCNEDKKILCFGAKNSALQFLAEKNLQLYQNDEYEIMLYDFDWLNAWIKSDDVNVICNDILNFWNIFTDIAYSTGVNFKGDNKNASINIIYDKLFYGNNILKPSDEEDYIPIWDKKQIKLIKSIMKNGIEMFISTIKQDRFDYTKWRENLFEDMTIEEINKKATEFMRNHPELIPKNAKII